MFRSMDKVLSENRQLDLEFELMMANRLNYSEIFSSERKETTSEVEEDHFRYSSVGIDNNISEGDDDKGQKKM